MYGNPPTGKGFLDVARTSFQHNEALMLAYSDRLVAFDSNILTYFLEGNNGQYSSGHNDSIADQRLAAVRLFMYGQCFIVRTVTAEAFRISDPTKREVHEQFIYDQFAETPFDTPQEKSIAHRVAALLPQHRTGVKDCWVLAEVEEWGIPVLVTWDKDFRELLTPHTWIRLQTPVECWEAWDIPSGTPPARQPLPDHPLFKETWWQW